MTLVFANLACHSELLLESRFSKVKDEENPETEELVQLQISRKRVHHICWLRCRFGTLQPVWGILEEVRLQRNDHEEEEVIEQLMLPPPLTRKDALGALTVLHGYFEHKNADLNNVDALDDQFYDLFASSTIQKKVSNYLKWSFYPYFNVLKYFMCVFDILFKCLLPLVLYLEFRLESVFGEKKYFLHVRCFWGILAKKSDHELCT